MQRFYNEKRDVYGRVEPSASVSVFVSGTATLATIYLASDPLDTPIVATSNPFLTDSNGQFSFAAADGVYDIVVKGSGSNLYLHNLYISSYNAGALPGDAVSKIALANNADNAKGAALVGYSSGLTYPVGTAGRAIADTNAAYIAADTVVTNNYIAADIAVSNALTIAYNAADVVAVNGVYSNLADTTTVSKGDALIGVKSTLPGGVARTQHQKNAETISVLDVGADPTAAVDCTSLINALCAAAPGATILVPSGNYKITGTITTNGCTIQGSGPQPANAGGTVFTVSGTQLYSAFLIDFGSGGVKDCWIQFGNAMPPTANTTMVGIEIATNASNPQMVVIDRVYIKGAHTAVYDHSGSYMCELSRVFAMYCVRAFYKSGGTTISYKNCFANYCDSAWVVTGCQAVNLTCCGADYLTEAGYPTYPPFYFAGMASLTIESFDLEATTWLNQNASGLVQISGVDSFTVNGFNMVGCQVGTSVGETYVFKVMNSVGTIKSFNPYSINYATTTYSGVTVYVVASFTGSVVSLESCNIPTPTGATNNFSTLAMPGTSLYIVGGTIGTRAGTGSTYDNGAPSRRP